MIRTQKTDGSANSKLSKQVVFKTIDGNEAAAYVAYRLNEVMSIYPITPSSNMAEWCDQWSAVRKPNLYGTVPRLVEMQSEAGAAGAVQFAEPVETGDRTAACEPFGDTLEVVAEEREIVHFHPC